jgi:4a-hydroxytetrahydrobiopterin dehydratase
MSREQLDRAAVDAAMEQLHGDWTGSTQELRRSIEFADFGTAVEFINRLAPLCEAADHHPDLGLRWRWIDVVLSTHSAGGVTALDVAMARQVDEIAAQLPRPS